MPVTPFGYQTAIITSDNTAWGYQRFFMKSEGLDVFFDSESTTVPTAIDPRDGGFVRAFKLGIVRSGTLPDRVTVDVLLPWVSEKVALGQPYFLHTMFQEMHFPYELRGGGEKPFQPSDMNFEMSFLKYPKNKVENVRNTYLNAAHEMDRQVGRLLDLLEEREQMSKTIIVFCGDHGEAFFDNGYVTHGQEPIEPVVRVPMIVYAPGIEPETVSYPVQLIDVAPTICALAGLPPHPGFQGIDILSADRPPLEKRNLYFHVSTPLWRGEAILSAGRWKLWYDQAREVSYLFDLENDPGERRNVLVEYPRIGTALGLEVRRWRETQLAYYAYSLYHRHYYPPRNQAVDLVSTSSEQD